jgi:nucleoside-diphosphate-sugar epimerase
MNIVIMGATSHIAKGLIESFLHLQKDNLHLYSRSPNKVRQFLHLIGMADKTNYILCSDYNRFLSGSYDVIINCIGVETRNSHDCDFTRYFTVTEEFDNLAINYLKNCNPDALYISFSSGAVYGKSFSKSVDETSVNCIAVNQITKQDYYGIVRINAEAKHRSHEDLRIIDLRIFSYFSRYINLTDGYFITDVIQAIRHNTVLYTDCNNIVRDYLHPDDLFMAIRACIGGGQINRAIDINSAEPIAKQEILNYFSSAYGLKYEKRSVAEKISATGAKRNYFSTATHAASIGFTPQRNSMESIRHEAAILLKGTVGL